MASESSPSAPGRVTVDLDAEIAALRSANDRDRQACDEIMTRIASREQNVRFLEDLAARAKGGVVAAIHDTGTVDAPPPVKLQQAAGSDDATYVGPKLTQKYMSLCVLEDAGDEGLLAVEIIAGAGRLFPHAKTIERTSLSPLLAKMADAERGDLFVRHHAEANRWSITEAGLEELRRLREAA